MCYRINSQQYCSLDNIYICVCVCVCVSRATCLKTCEIMALQTLGILEDLATALSNLGLKKVGFLVWKLQKRRDGYSVNIFWRNAEKPRDTTSFSAHCEVMSKRKRRSQQRLEQRPSSKRRRLKSCKTPFAK